MLPKGRTIISRLTVTLWTKLTRIDLQKTYLNRYDREWIETVIGLGAFWDFYSPEFELNAHFASSNLTLKQRKGKFYISQVNRCGVSVAREQQHDQDLKRIYKREYEFTNSSLLPECIAFKLWFDFHNSCFWKWKFLNLDH